MQYFVSLSAVILAASALPTDFGSRSNATLFNTGLAGFGSSAIGGKGGAVWTVWDPWALRDAVETDIPRIVYVRGRLDLTLLFTGSPGIIIRIGSYKTIIGGDSNAEIFGGGFTINTKRHVIVQNLKITNSISYAPGEQPDGSGGIISAVPGAYSLVDGIDMGHSERIWVDHCEFSDDPWDGAGTPENLRRHDGLIDIRQGSSLISISNNIFRNHNMVGLVGNSDNTGHEDIGRLKVTYYLNWFQGTVQRHPFVRFGQVHILNNLYSNVKDYGIGVGVGAQVYSERNVFINTRRAWVRGFTSPAPTGYYFNDNNLLFNSPHDTDIPANVNWHPRHHYGYIHMNERNVEAHVRTYAGTW